MDAELIVYIWAAACGALGGIGRFCRNYNLWKRWKVISIFSLFICCVVVGSVCAMIVVGFTFDKSIIQYRLRAFALATFVGYIPIELPRLVQMAHTVISMNSPAVTGGSTNNKPQETSVFNEESNG